MPSFWVLRYNEKETGATLFFIDEKIDAGQIFLQRRISIEEADTVESIIRKTKQLGADLIIEAIEKIERGNIVKKTIDIKKGCYCGWPKRSDVIEFKKLGKRFR